jgi:hypothetical protein
MERLSLDDLVLWGLANKGLEGTTEAKLKDRLKAYGTPSAVHESCERLLTLGFAAIEKGKRSKKYRVTSKGLEKTRAFADPGKVTWRTFQEKHLPAHCLQISVPKDKSRGDFSDSIRTALIRDLFKIPLMPGATLKQALDRVLVQYLGQPARMKVTQAVLLQALSVDSSNEAESNVTAAEDDLNSFAYAVRQAMDRTKEGWVGSRVFISRVWNTLTAERRFPEMTLDSFKQRLLEANRRELLTLARADMAPTYDQSDVTASEIRWEHSTFHFLIRGLGRG